mmetsp:Transcript_16124/g.41397  ORF Transcript_16124/g.41397 Transcript_16124/m.41397 type:complete len:353 (+) Transcript_16124:1421-2479(+)
MRKTFLPLTIVHITSGEYHLACARLATILQVTFVHLSGRVHKLATTFRFRGQPLTFVGATFEAAKAEKVMESTKLETFTNHCHITRVQKVRSGILQGFDPTISLKNGFRLADIHYFWSENLETSVLLILLWDRKHIRVNPHQMNLDLFSRHGLNMLLLAFLFLIHWRGAGNHQQVVEQHHMRIRIKLLKTLVEQCDFEFSKHEEGPVYTGSDLFHTGDCALRFIKCLLPLSTTDTRVDFRRHHLHLFQRSLNVGKIGMLFGCCFQELLEKQTIARDTLDGHDQQGLERLIITIVFELLKELRDLFLCTNLEQKVIGCFVVDTIVGVGLETGNQLKENITDTLCLVPFGETFV